MFGSQEDNGQLRQRTPARDEDHLEEDPLSHLLQQADSLSDGCEEEQTRAYNLLRNEENVVSSSPHTTVCTVFYKS